MYRYIDIMKLSPQSRQWTFSPPPPTVSFCPYIIHLSTTLIHG